MSTIVRKTHNDDRMICPVRLTLSAATKVHWMLLTQGYCQRVSSAPLRRDLAVELTQTRPSSDRGEAELFSMDTTPKNKGF